MFFITATHFLLALFHFIFGDHKPYLKEHSPFPFPATQHQCQIPLSLEPEDADGTPERVRRVPAGLHGAKDVVGDGAVQPGDDGVVVLDPVGGALGVGAVDVVEQSKLGEDGEEAETPWTVVGLVKIEYHGNVGFDVDQLNLGGRSRVGDDWRDVKIRGGRRSARRGGSIGGGHEG